MIAAGGENAQTIVIYGGILIVAFCVLGVLVIWVRRSLFKSSATNTQTDWTLGELRDLKKRGRITESEYQALKARVLAEAGVDPETIKRATSADET